LAAVLNGLQDEPRTKITAIGVGALGSQIAMNLARSGYKDWTLIDEDFLLPHNLARHELSYIVGQPKARLMADNINALFGEVAAAKSIVANVLDSEHTTDDILSAFSEADVILDISTSVPVSRYLARDVETKARKISLFLNPSGHEFVLLAEDLSGTISLDSLEMQYYREIIRNELLISHLVDGAALRYGGSCRDVTSRIPHWLVSLHASIAAGALQDIMANGSAQSVIWRAAKHSGTVGRIDISLSSKVEIKIKEWLLVTDTFFLKKIQDLRASKLPNETGGVLIGSFDHSRKLIYVVDTVPSPSDSEEWPTYYYRGCEGLRDSVEAIKQKTMSNLTYIGEWHSHPDRASCEPSTDDLKVLDWLYQEMVKVDTPALILIAGEMGKCNWLLEEEG
jgi:integrative and conjugative element protein (TIGR02256 family)